MTYSNSLAQGRRNMFASRHQNAVTFRSRDRRFGPITNISILVILACLLGLLYLTQVTKTNAYGYQINGLQKQQSQLQQQYNNLEVNSAELQAVSRVQTSTVAQALVPVTPSGTVN
jgi:cell division protein FtsL